jgi:hypothetical protein
MLTNRWVETSRSIYAAFLALYPQEHRAEYGESMRQVFTDQCRSAYEQKGALGIVFLWLRTLPDLGYTALVEHITSPRVTWGLMEPVPNAPLPWKGVFLILLPGLVYLVSQIAQLIGQPWYMTVYYRAAFLLIIPVLLVWVVTRRFPIWGLIPVGLLYRLLQEIGYQLITLHPDVFSSNPVLNVILNIAKLVQKQLSILSILFIIAIVFLAWRYAKQQKPPHNFWIWLGLYLLTVTIQITGNAGFVIQHIQEVAPHLSVTQQKMFLEFMVQELYNMTAFLLMIFIGTLFTRRHGFFATLLPVGYILPMVVVGLPWYLDLESKPVELFTISAAILAYRSLLSLVGPIWISRTCSQADKKRAVLVSITLALGIHAVMQFFPGIAFPSNTYQPSIAFTLLTQIELISGIGLGITMYQTHDPAENTPGTIHNQTETIAEKA